MRVRTGATYRYSPPEAREWPELSYGEKAGFLKTGNKVRVIRPAGSPVPPFKLLFDESGVEFATIETLTGEFAGTVPTAWLEKVR